MEVGDAIVRINHRQSPVAFYKSACNIGFHRSSFADPPAASSIRFSKRRRHRCLGRRPDLLKNVGVLF